MHTFTRIARGAGLCLTLGLCSAAGAAAGAAGPAVADAASQPADEGLEVIVVTANKRAEDLQKIPIAVTAITADEATAAGVVNGQTLAQMVPGLQLNRQTNGTTPFIRGVGNPSTQAGTEPGVAMYVDDVYYGSSAVALTNYNTIERIEVLKGPQGTLFGRNATGGVIQIFTKNPTADPHVDVNVGVANYDTKSGDIYATGRLTDTLIGNIAAYGEKETGGWGRNFTTGHPTYLLHDYGGRAKLLWTPGDRTSVLLNVDYDDFFNQQAVYFRPAPGTKSSAGASSIPPPGVYDTFENLDPTAADKQYGGSIKINQEFSAVNFVSISAYRHSLATQVFAQDGSSIFRLNPTLVYATKTWTQEFQVLSPAASKIAWVAGLFFLKDTTTVDPFQFHGLLAGGGLASRGAVATQDTKSYSGFFQTTVPLNATSNLTAGVRYTSDDRSLVGGRQNTSAAGITSPISYAKNSGVSKTWSSVSGRLSLDHRFTDSVMGYVAWNRGFKSGLFNTILAPSFGPPAPPAAPPVPTLDPPVEPEKIDAFSAGVKTQFLDNRLRVNVDAFYYKYKNLQLQSVYSIPGGGTATLLTNAAAATMKGVDIDITAEPVKHLTVTVGLEVMDGKYDDFPNGQFNVYRPAVGGNCTWAVNNAAGCTGVTPPNYNPNPLDPLHQWNLRGNKTIQTPPFSGNLTVAYLQKVPFGSFNYTVNLYHSGNYYADADNGLGQIAPSSANNDRQAVLDIVNASIAWTSLSERWGLRVWGKNLGDTRYWSFANETGTITKNTPAPPRTYGLTASAHF